MLVQLIVTQTLHIHHGDQNVASSLAVESLDQHSGAGDCVLAGASVVTDSHLKAGEATGIMIWLKVRWK